MRHDQVKERSIKLTFSLHIQRHCNRRAECDARELHLLARVRMACILNPMTDCSHFGRSKPIIFRADNWKMSESYGKWLYKMATIDGQHLKPGGKSWPFDVTGWRIFDFAIPRRVISLSLSHTLYTHISLSLIVLFCRATFKLFNR